MFVGTTYLEISDDDGNIPSKVELEYYTDYELLDYLETSGSQYIDTNFKPNQNTKVEIKIGIDEAIVGTSALFGARTSTVGNAFAVFASTGAAGHTSEPRFDYSASVASQVYEDPLNVGENIIIKDGNHNHINGVQLTGNSGGIDFDCEYNLYIGTINTANTPLTDGFIGRIYYAKVWDNDTLIREFVPVKMNNGEVCFYDLVHDKYYRNSGIENFIESN